MFKRSDSISRSNPFTPMRRFFFKLELLKPIITLGKRMRDQSYAAEHLPEEKAIDHLSSITTPAFIKNQVHHQTARVALQQHDQPLDAIVITTLPSYPFCCHEDLLMMSRSQLVEAAILLNSRLPACSQIELADGIPDAQIRHSIETLVGIVPDMPGAPKAIKSRTFEWMDSHPEQDTLPSPPTSPLSMRVSRRQEKALPVMTSPPHSLERLEEEDENFFTMNRPLKKRKVISSNLNEDIDMEGATPFRAQDLRLPMNLLRSIPSIEQSSPSPTQSLDAFKVIDSVFVKSKPRYRSTTKNATRTSNKKGRLSQPDSSKKREQRQAIRRTFNYLPFELPASNSDQYSIIHTKPLSSTSTTSSSGSGSSNSSDEKVAIVEDDDNGISPVEHEDNQVAGQIENMNVNGEDETGV